MFILLHGAAEVFVRSNGRETQVASLEAGDYCGEMSLLTGEPRSATVVAKSDCELWEIDKHVMGELLRENDTLAQRLHAAGISPRQSRSTALFTLAADVPAAILAKTLGIHVKAAIQWQKISGGDWAAYAADVSSRPGH